MDLRPVALAALLASPSLAGTIDVLSASPDAPAIELGWRGSLRAKAGQRISFVGPPPGRAGVLFEVPAFIELHNTPGNDSVVPWELWRARIALGGGYRWILGDVALAALVSVEHESDHATAPNLVTERAEVGFFAFNDVALSARAQRRARHPQFAQLTARLHVLTCTVSLVTCGEGLGLRGDRSFEASVEAGQVLELGEAGRWGLFAALSGDVLVGTPLIAPARRAGLRLGGLWRLRASELSLSLFGLAGTDVGFVRGPDTLQGGVQLGWSMAD